MLLDCGRSRNSIVLSCSSVSESASTVASRALISKTQRPKPLKLTLVLGTEDLR